MIVVQRLDDSNGSWKTIKEFSPEYKHKIKWYLGFIPWTTTECLKTPEKACLEAVNHAKILNGIIRVKSELSYYGEDLSKIVWINGKWLCSVYDI